MIRTRTGTVVSRGGARRGIEECIVECEGRHVPALNVFSALGHVAPGERVLLNTTAVDLALGTGGFHLVMARLTGGDTEAPGPGHAMKLRYTPWQLRVTCVEEHDGAGHDELLAEMSLDGMPVVVCGLHSGVLAAIVGASGPGLSVAVVINDAGALPAGLSRSLAMLESAGTELTVITAGHAFGGDLETVNVHSALLAARHVTGADVAIVGMGPGVLGTGTLLGHSELRQAEDLNAVAALGGTPLAVPRLSQGDQRDRHRGVSHHTLVVLGVATLRPVLVVMPYADRTRRSTWLEQLSVWSIPDRHHLIWLDPGPALEAVRRAGVDLTTMGRAVDEEPDYFAAAALAGMAAAEMAGGGSNGR